MRARIQTWRTRLRKRQYKVTRGGLLFTLAASVVAVAAAISANNLLFLVLSTMISTLLVSDLVSRLCLAGLELDLLVPEHVCAQRVISGRLYVRNLKIWMPSFSIHVVGLESGGPPVTSVGRGRRSSMPIWAATSRAMPT